MADIWYFPNGIVATEALLDRATHRASSCLPSRASLVLQMELNQSLGNLSIDNEMHDDDVRNPRRIQSRVSFSAGKRKVKQCDVLRRGRVLILRLVALAMAFKNVQNCF